MFNLGLWEIFILAAVALIVVGPEKLPKLARDVARFLNEVKRTTGSFTNEMNKAFDEKDFRESNLQENESVKENLDATEEPIAELKNETEDEQQLKEKADV